MADGSMGIKASLSLVSESIHGWRQNEDAALISESKLWEYAAKEFLEFSAVRGQRITGVQAKHMLQDDKDELMARRGAEEGLTHRKESYAMQSMVMRRQRAE